ncbi:MAG TPA: thioredoxin domain-containing protein [Gemmatimonadaceae bacterium]|jgi:protein-disulfide isomerase
MAQKKAEQHRARRANVVRSQRAASLKPFYYALALVAVVGVALIVRTARRSAATQQRQVTNVAATAAKAEGHLLGNPNAPVQILEFADFECPHCAEYATITEPDVRKRIVDAGLASYRYFDFPLGHFENSIPASEAAACAGDQNKFWEMHDKLFQGQPEWNSQATSDPKKVFARYANELGLDTDAWGKCFDSQKHMPEILANRDEGLRRHVESTPTFVIGTKQIPGAIPYDMLKAYVDTAAAQYAANAVARADSQHSPAAKKGGAAKP